MTKDNSMSAQRKVRTKRDLEGDKVKTFAEKFNEFIVSFPSEQGGLDAYSKLPD